MHRTIDSDNLSALLELLVQSQTDTPTAVGIVDHGHRFELHIKALLGPDPVADLIGFRAPPPWAAFAVSGVGRLIDGEPASRDRPVELVHMVTREGQARTSVAVDGCPTDPDPDAAPHGRVPDICRRVLHLPTPPPPHDSAVLVAGLWLDEILRELLGRDLDDGPVTWAQCQSLLTPRPLSADALLDFARTFAETWPWAILRRIAIEEPILDLPDGAAEWFDDGSFARWVLAGLAPLSELRSDVVELLGPATGSRLDSLLDHWLGDGHR